MLKCLDNIQFFKRMTNLFFACDAISFIKYFFSYSIDSPFINQLELKVVKLINKVVFSGKMW